MPVTTRLKGRVAAATAEGERSDFTNIDAVIQHGNVITVGRENKVPYVSNPIQGDSMPTMSVHPAVHASHPAVVKRLKRASGHLAKVIEMIEAGRPCLDLAQQLHAVESAIHAAKKTLVHDHLDHCLDVAVSASGPAARAPIDEFKAITRYL